MSKKYTDEQVAQFNQELEGKTPAEIVAWAIIKAEKPVITTNFRPYEGAILHAVTSVKPSIDVVWCDTGYNTRNTYKHAEELIKLLDLNIDLYVPKQTSSHRDAVMGIPQIDDPMHKVFTEQVKLEPFKRAMAAHQPDVWFTNLRKGQTAFRDSISVVSQGEDGILKVSPFYNYSDEQLDAYLEENKIPNEHKYFDPTKVLGNRECGLHA
ncbi:phosphoadenosine phosphosulfate reductase domain-containing protein [Wenyingzhuangia aestuarii]|uniref:phosphoadenosine phosphosulfate reductase domain-containing protein n=1 Tax=Wenyingzhuangia aestuarii TaxID=1647582 RepID=UPI00143C716B|nr:phosphoadenosine phosphosulfate reductase family protein [Wenyingzhuangia aestuarii]NJB83173.1 phosphoadenosine phosphosulfate reductase [Wenyingzhuangia aestuarii]